MDKQTLSNYGWLVIVTLILAVMIALATPFGEYVGDAVVSVANGYVGASNSAMNDDNISNMEKEWYDKLNPIIAGATFTDGTFLTWEELKLDENGAKYGYMASGITDVSIESESFAQCDMLKNVVIPDNIIELSYGAFYSCPNLTSVTIPNSVTYMGWTFDSCSYLVNIKYLGTKTEWDNIEKNDWNLWCPQITLVCTDVTETIPEYEG